MTNFKTYFLPFIVLTTLIQAKTFVDSYAYTLNFNPEKNLLAHDKIPKVRLTRTAIAYKRKEHTDYQLLHFADPETSFDFKHYDEMTFHLYPKGISFDLVEDGKSGTGNIVFKRKGEFFYNREARAEYSIYKPTDRKIYQGTMNDFMVGEFERFSKDLEGKLLKGKFPVKVKLCKPAVDIKVGRSLNQYGNSEKLYQQLLTEYVEHQENFMKTYKLDNKIVIIDKFLVPIREHKEYAFCSLVEFKDLGAYVAFQNFPQ